MQVFADGKRYADAKPVDTYANCFVRRSRAAVSLDGTTVSELAAPHDGGTAVPSSQLRLADLAAQSQPSVGEKEVR